MARQRNPKRDEARRLYNESGGEIKLTDLADRLGVPASRIRKWKSEDQWERSDLEKKERSVSKQKNKVIKRKLLKSVENNEELTDKQRLFCLHYASSHNALQSYLKAYQCSKNVAMVEAYRLIKKPRVASEIKQLKEIMSTELDIGPDDMIRYCLKIVGADIGDFVHFGRKEVPVFGMYGPLVDKKTKKPITEVVNYIDMSESDMLDTAIISKIKQGKDGISIEMADKKWAWDKLENYFGWKGSAPNDEDDVQIIDDLGGAPDAGKTE